VRNYIREKIEKTPSFFKFGNIEIVQDSPLSDQLEIDTLLKMVEKTLPKAYFRDLKAIHIGDYEEFTERSVNALYRDGKLYVSNHQDNYSDLLDDVVHEIAHHVETLYPEDIYSDTTLIAEFLQKRFQLEFELKSEGYWTSEYDFRDMRYSEAFDTFLYKRVGKKVLAMATTGIFIRPYASVSMREYFATGFEAYYLGRKNELHNISPALYAKISELDSANTHRL